MATPAVKIPRVPSSIKTPEGKALWKLIWSAKAEQLEPSQDIFFVKMIVEAEELINEMRAYIGADHTILINNEATEVLHPLYKQITELTKQQTGWYRALGFTPMDRSKLQLEAAQEGVNPFAEFRTLLNGGAKK